MTTKKPTKKSAKKSGKKAPPKQEVVKPSKAVKPGSVRPPKAGERKELEGKWQKPGGWKPSKYADLLPMQSDEERAKLLQRMAESGFDSRKAVTVARAGQSWQVLDGRNRLAASIELRDVGARIGKMQDAEFAKAVAKLEGAEQLLWLTIRKHNDRSRYMPSFEVFEGEAAAQLEFVVGENLVRRNLSAGAVAMVLVDVYQAQVELGVRARQGKADPNQTDLKLAPEDVAPKRIDVPLGRARDRLAAEHGVSGTSIARAQYVRQHAQSALGKRAQGTIEGVLNGTRELGQVEREIREVLRQRAASKEAIKRAREVTKKMEASSKSSKSKSKPAERDEKQEEIDRSAPDIKRTVMHATGPVSIVRAWACLGKEQPEDHRDPDPLEVARGLMDGNRYHAALAMLPSAPTYRDTRRSPDFTGDVAVLLDVDGLVDEPPAHAFVLGCALEVRRLLPRFDGYPREEGDQSLQLNDWIVWHDPAGPSHDVIAWLASKPAGSGGLWQPSEPAQGIRPPELFVRLLELTSIKPGDRIVLFGDYNLAIKLAERLAIDVDVFTTRADLFSAEKVDKPKTEVDQIEAHFDEGDDGEPDGDGEDAGDDHGGRNGDSEGAGDGDGDGDGDATDATTWAEDHCPSCTGDIFARAHCENRKDQDVANPGESVECRTCGWKGQVGWYTDLADAVEGDPKAYTARVVGWSEFGPDEPGLEKLSEKQREEVIAEARSKSLCLDVARQILAERDPKFATKGKKRPRKKPESEAAE